MFDVDSLINSLRAFNPSTLRLFKEQLPDRLAGLDDADRQAAIDRLSALPELTDVDFGVVRPPTRMQPPPTPEPVDFSNPYDTNVVNPITQPRPFQFGGGASGGGVGRTFEPPSDIDQWMPRQPPSQPSYGAGGTYGGSGMTAVQERAQQEGRLVDPANYLWQGIQKAGEVINYPMKVSGTALMSAGGGDPLVKTHYEEVLKPATEESRRLLQERFNVTVPPQFDVGDMTQVTPEQLKGLRALQSNKAQMAEASQASAAIWQKYEDAFTEKHGEDAFSFKSQMKRYEELPFYEQIMLEMPANVLAAFIANPTYSWLGTLAREGQLGTKVAAKIARIPVSLYEFGSEIGASEVGGMKIPKKKPVIPEVPTLLETAPFKLKGSETQYVLREGGIVYRIDRSGIVEPIARHIKGEWVAGVTDVPFNKLNMGTPENIALLNSKLAETMPAPKVEVPPIEPPKPPVTKLPDIDIELGEGMRWTPESRKWKSEFIELSNRVGIATENKGTLSSHYANLPEDKLKIIEDAFNRSNAGDTKAWKTASRAMGFTEQEIADFGRLDVLTKQGYSLGATEDELMGVMEELRLYREAPPVPPPIPPTPEEALIQKMISITKQQKELRVATKQMQAASRAPKFAQIEELAKTPRGEQTFDEIGRALEGKLGFAKGELPVLTQAERNLGYDMIAKSTLKTPEVYPAQKAWTRLFNREKFALRFPDEQIDMPLRDFELKYFKKVYGEEFVAQIAKDDKWLRRAMKANDVFFDVYYNSLLGGKSIPRNLGSNILRTALNPIETALAVPASFLTKSHRGWGEVSAEVFGSLRGIQDGLRESFAILKTGGRLQIGQKVELAERVIPGKLGRVIGIPSTLMEAGDALLLSPLRQGSLNKFAYRQAMNEGLKGESLLTRYAALKANPTPELMGMAEDAALKGLFRNQHPISQVIIHARDKRIAGFQPLRLVIPFVNVPVNVAGYGLARSPISILNPRTIANIIKGKPEAADQISKWLIGTMAAGSIALYASSGNLTGAAPLSVNARDRFYREGKQPFSVKIGDTWVSYQQIPVLSSTLTMLASAIDAINNKDKTAADQSAQVTYDIARNTVEQTYLTGLSDFLDAISDPEKFAEAYVKRIVPSLVPFSSTQRLVAQGIDTTIRQPRNVGEGIMTNIPGVSQQVPAKLTAFGEEITRPTPWYSPINISQEDNSRLNQELGKYQVNIGFVKDSIENVKLTKEEQRQYQELAGQSAKQEILKLIQSPQYQNLSPEEAKKALERAADRGKDETRHQLIIDGTVKVTPDIKARELRQEYLKPYYAIDDKVWALYPASLRELSDSIKKLEKGNDREKALANKTLARYPQIVKARDLIALRRKEYRKDDKFADDLLRR